MEKRTLGVWGAAAAFVTAAALAVAMSSCGKKDEAANGKSKTEGVAINGAGATFPDPIYKEWASKYHDLTGLKWNYQAIGSGGGIKQIKDKTVDFGASDKPLKKEELDAAGLIQFPMIMGGVVPVINVKGIEPGQLKLTGKLIADIYMGTVAKWNDPAIASLNPDVTLPDQAIAVVHRSDGSGTTWIFTNYLCKVSPEWKDKVGNSDAVNWPTGMGGKGNPGVASNVMKVGGAIGYVEFAYALQNKMCHTQMQNQAGKYVQPTFEAFAAAAAGADWKNAPAMYMVLTDQPGDASWPITGASFILVYRDQKDAAKAETVLKFFDWCYKNGEEAAKTLYYVPIPQPVYELVESQWRDEVTSGGQKVWK